ncbi:hypothetical protein SD074_21430 [Prolixibacter sp. SD074]|nr:hypothetical protein SD074_21430 [Prolixibacter sp. SD074]
MTLAPTRIQTTKEELFVQQLLEERDAFYRETSRLKSQLSDFDGLDLLPAEKEQAEAARAGIESYKTVRVKVKEKNTLEQAPAGKSSQGRSPSLPGKY